MVIEVGGPCVRISAPQIWVSDFRLSAPTILRLWVNHKPLVGHVRLERCFQVIDSERSYQDYLR